jgi:bacterioferritin-associated ferredoxin
MNPNPVWNRFKTPFFLLRRAGHSNIEGVPLQRNVERPAASMIVCSCNVISDHDVRSAVESAQDLPRSPKQLYGCLGCSAECGRCARTIKTIIEDALGACARVCCPGCPHSQAGEYETFEDVFADEAETAYTIEA